MSFVQVPPDSTGKKVDTNTIGLTERQIAIIGDAVSSSGLAVVTTSAGLMVNVSSGLVTFSSAPTVNISSGIISFSSSPTVNVSSGVINLSSAGITQVIPVTSSGVNLYTTAGINVVSASSGLVQTLTTGPLQVLTSGPITLAGTVTIVSASSGLIQTLTTGATVLSSSGITQIIPVTSSGINLYTTAGINVVSASSGLIQTLTTGPLQVLTSGTIIIVSASSGLIQTLTTGALVLSSVGITQVLVTGSSGGQATVTSSGGLGVTILGGAAAGSTAVNLTNFSGAGAGVTSSAGLQVTTVPGGAASQILSYSYVSSSSLNSVTVKGTPGTFYGFYAINSTSVMRYLKVYGTSSGPVAGASTASIIGQYGIPANGPTGAGAAHPLPYGVTASNGLSFIITANMSATDTGVIGASDIGLTLYYI